MSVNKPAQQGTLSFDDTDIDGLAETPAPYQVAQANNTDETHTPPNNHQYDQWIAQTLERLSHSPFRAKFALTDKDRAYARAKGKTVIARHARELLRSRVGDAEPKADGRQTPWRGHPVFTAQHATACCCRGCIAKWHHIELGHRLSDEDIDRLAALIMAWIERDLTQHPAR